MLVSTSTSDMGEGGKCKTPFEIGIVNSFLRIVTYCVSEKSSSYAYVHIYP